MKAYRYNVKKRTDRRFNTTGREKNPNSVKFYAASIESAEPYKTIYDKMGYELYTCDLEVVDLRDDLVLFNMEKYFSTTRACGIFVSTQINKQLSDYTMFMNRAKTKKEKKMWKNNIDGLKTRERELVSSLFANEFQQLSDFELQDILISELKDGGFDGYFTKKEFAIF